MRERRGRQGGLGHEDGSSAGNSPMCAPIHGVGEELGAAPCLDLLQAEREGGEERGKKRKGGGRWQGKDGLAWSSAGMRSRAQGERRAVLVGWLQKTRWNRSEGIPREMVESGSGGLRIPRN